MASQPNLQKPPKWVKEQSIYRIRSLAFGEFTARCVFAAVGWARMEIREISPQLEEAHYKVGQQVDVSCTFCRVQELS